MNNGENMYSQNLQQLLKEVMSVNWLFNIDEQHDGKVLNNLVQQQLEYTKQNQGKMSNDITNRYNNYNTFCYNKKFANGVSVEEISKNFDIYIKKFLNTFNSTFNLIKEGVESGKITQEEFDKYKEGVKETCQKLINKHGTKQVDSNTIGLQDKISEEIDKTIGLQDVISKEIDKTNHQEAIKQLKQELNNLKLIAEKTIAIIYFYCVNGTNILCSHSCQPTFTPNEVLAPEELVEENRCLDAIFQIISAFAKDFDEQIKELSGGKGAKFGKGIGLGGTGYCVVQ